MGVIRAAQHASANWHLIGADPDPTRAPGSYICDSTAQIPMANQDTYIDQLMEVLKARRAVMLIPTTDAELPIIAANREFIEQSGARVLISSPEVVSIADDKQHTSDFLRNHDFPFPETYPGNKENEVRELYGRKGALVKKPRSGGRRSVGVTVIRTEADLDEALNDFTGKYVFQEELPSSDGLEFTAGCLIDRSGSCRTVCILSRELRDGNTYKAYSGTPKEFDEYVPAIRAIADALGNLGAFGPINLQFRLVDNRPVVFEINARFSGTTPIRAFLGHNEVDLMIKHVISSSPLPARFSSVLVPHKAVHRVWSDIMIDTDQDPRQKCRPFGFAL